MQEIAPGGFQIMWEALQRPFDFDNLECLDDIARFDIIVFVNFYLCNAFVMLIRFYRYDSKDFVNGQAARLLCSEELPQRKR